MFKKLITILFKDFYLFSAAYSNNIFPEPLSKEEEEKLLEMTRLGNTDARNTNTYYILGSSLIILFALG